jgi:hypothetical protein
MCCIIGFLYPPPPQRVRPFCLKIEYSSLEDRGWGVALVLSLECVAHISPPPLRVVVLLF